MKFRFNVKLSDQDYIDFNVFSLYESPYGNKTKLTLRIMITILFITLALLGLTYQDYSTRSIVAAVILMVFLLVIQLRFKKFIVSSVKRTVKSLNKKGKLGYSKESVIEFYDDYFVETTEEGKTEHKSTAIERVSVVDNKVIYIHINSVMSYILPKDCFESKEQFDVFLGFIKTKCENIDFY